MKALSRMLPLTAVIALCGCVPSLSPFYTSKDIAFDKKLLGDWKQVDGNSQWKFSKEKGKPNQYHVVMEAEEQGKKKRAEFVGTLVKIKGESYLDLFPAAPKGMFEDTHPLWAMHVLPAHTLSRVSLTDDSCEIRFMNPQWAKKYLKDNPGELAHREVQKDQIVLTADTKDLQRFVDKHKDTKDAFLKPIKLKKQ